MMAFSILSVCVPRPMSGLGDNQNNNDGYPDYASNNGWLSAIEQHVGSIDCGRNGFRTDQTMTD